MKKFVLLFVCMFAMASMFAQTNFQELTLEKALEKAKAEDKYVFVDCYTVWCGPCRMMSEKVLPLKEVGEYMNKKFVCIKVDMEKGEGLNMARKYQVSAYPTFLVLTADGNLLHRVVGASVTGEEFIKKIEAGFDENSASNLEKEYAAGNRDMNFLVRYIKALLVSCDWDKAKNVAQEVIASLSDEEKCMEPYWFIYENIDLSPIGSGNVNYLLKHIDQFRQKMGVEKVDRKLASLFEIQLEDILRGRNRKATLEDVEKIKQMLDSYQLVGQDYLYNYIELIKAVKTANTNQTLDLYKKIFPKLSDEKIAYLYFMPILDLKEKWNEAQKKELLVLTQQMEEQVEYSKLKASLRNFRTGMLERM
ncbi:thioredoxin family protein [Butyricimonas synergistica]|uniref:thioredoxin family protein n=1 Tax=Butyricimonas synergistica TaxID=544644 RepID=UPI000361E4A5|nr:thioredoxin family protein [Butyricimonas synergistica]